MIRICRDPKDSLDFGLDIKTLCEEGLIDAIVPTPEGIITDSGLPVAQWKTLVGGKIPVFAGLEARNIAMTASRAEHLRAYAAAFYASGADGIYLNNHEYHRPGHHAARCITRTNCTQGRREFVVTWQDTVADGNPCYRPLPLVLHEEGNLPLNIGPVNKTDKVRIIIDFEGMKLPHLRVGDTAFVSADIAAPITEYAAGKPVIVTSHRTLRYDLPEIDTNNALDLTFIGNGVIHYVNVIVENDSP
jgi:hypothetical protein